MCCSGLLQDTLNTARQRGVCRGGRQRGGVWGGNTIPDPCFLLIGALDSQRTPFNGARRPPGHTGTLAAPRRGPALVRRSSSPSHSHPITPASPQAGEGIEGVGGWVPPPTLWSFMQHASLPSSCFFFFFLATLLGELGMF